MSEQTGPIAGRLRRPGWRDPRLLIGILLVALSVAVVASIVSNADKTMPYYAARDTLPAGTVLSEANVVVINARVSGSSYIGVDSPPWGMVLSRTVGQGELLPGAALVKPADFDGRPVAVRSSLPLAPGIGPGSLVDVFLTTFEDGKAGASLVGEKLVIHSVNRDQGGFGATGRETVFVIVPERQIEDFLVAIATDGEISVVGLTAGSQR